MNKITNKRSASQTIYGFTFQIDAAIHIFVKNIRSCSFIAIEGENDITFYDKSNHLHVVQVKSATNENGIKYKKQLDKVKKALESFEIVYGKKPIDFRIVINFQRPFSNADTFKEDSNEILLFSKLNKTDSKTLKDYFKSKGFHCFSLSKTSFEHIPYKTDNTKRCFIMGELDDFVKTIKTDEIGLNIDKSIIHSRWFNVINDNGVESDEMISKDELAGTAFNYLKQTNPKLDLYFKHRKSIIELESLNYEFVLDTYNSVVSIPIAISDNNKFRSLAFENDLDLSVASDYELDLFFDNTIATSIDVPAIIKELTCGKEEYANEIFRWYVASILLNTNLINKVKGEFGYEN